MIRWRRYKNLDGSSRYEAQRLEQSDAYHATIARTVGYVTMTGRPGVDDYPWDWYLAPAVHSPAGVREAGVSDTLRSGKAYILAALGESEGSRP
jgi:hypothetical protein